MIEYDAILKNARICGWGENDWVIGLIYGDKKKRFKDGEEVSTSAIISGPDENGIVHTRNSIYKIEK